MTDDPAIAVLDLDIADLCLNPTRTRVWAPIGVPWPVEPPGTNQKQPIFGAVHSRLGRTFFACRAHKRSGDFQHFVDHVLLPAYPEVDFLILLVDGANIFTSKSTRAWLRERPQVVLVPLPKYAPQENRQELIWRWLRAEVTHNHPFRAFADLLAAAEHFCAKAQTCPDEVRRRIGRTDPDPLGSYLADIA